MPSVLKEWVTHLGLRHQGVLMACVRGCDNVPKEDPTKALARCLRDVLLNSFDPRPSSFIEHVDDVELRDLVSDLRKAGVRREDPLLKDVLPPLSVSTGRWRGCWKRNWALCLRQPLWSWWSS